MLTGNFKPGKYVIFFRGKNVFNLLIRRQERDLDQIWNNEAACFREASQVSGGDANILGTLIVM